MVGRDILKQIEDGLSGVVIELAVGAQQSPGVRNRQQLAIRRGRTALRA